MRKPTARRRRPPKRRRKTISLDITPAVPAGRQLIQSYGGGRFRIGGKVHEGSVLVAAEETLSWPATATTDITIENLTPLLGEAGILVIGCGPTFQVPPADLRAALKDHGIVLEWMDTGAACRTFNVLLTEERSATAALIAVD